jgi:hypothetical protein
MATRKNPIQAPQPREKIRTSMLINRLQDFAFGRCRMTPRQVRAALAVLPKNLPDLNAVEVQADYTNAEEFEYHAGKASTSFLLSV